MDTGQNGAGNRVEPRREAPGERPGPLAVLAGAVRGPQVPLARLLGDLSRALDLERVEWWPREPERAPTGARGRPREREIDRPWLDALPPGTVARPRSDAGARRPRLAACPPGETWVRASAEAPGQGWLRLLGARGSALPAGELVGLADLVARHARQAVPTAEGPGESLAWSALVHDLRNELTFAQLALERAALEEAAPTSEVLDTLARAGDLCNGALQRGSGETAPRAVPLQAILQAEARAAAESGRGRGDARVRVRCAAAVHAAADPVSLGRVVRNLVLNALEACEPGGSVALHAERDGPRVRIHVEDDGRGMTAQEMHDLFRPGTTGGGGTGWGTASILAGVAQLDGRIALESGPGEGTRVEVELWAAPPADRPSLVLVDADTERATRRARALAAEGVGVWVVGDPDRARRLIATEPRVGRVEIPAGGSSAGGHPSDWRALRAECRARGLAFEVRSCAATRRAPAGRASISSTS